MSQAWLNTALDIVNRLNRYSDANISPSSNQSYPKVVVDTKKLPSSASSFITLAQFGSIEYDSQHLWALKIDGSPAPFDRWFPAQSVEEVTKGPSTTSMSYGIDEINMLNAYNAITMRVEILDDEAAKLETWLKQWQKDMSTDPLTGKPYIGFKYLDDILKRMTVSKYNWQKVLISKTEYYVLPVGQINLVRQNEPGLKQLNVNFAVFGHQQLSR